MTREPGRIRRWIVAATVQTWRAIDAAERTPDPVPGARFDWRPLIVLASAAVILTFQEMVGDLRFFRDHFPRAAGDGNWELKSFTWWTAWRVGGFLLVPAIVVWLMPGERLRDYGWSLRGFTRHWRLYVVMFLLVLPLLFITARTRAFQEIYPFYKQAGRSWFDFVAWELMYGAQFVALEFFFRGFFLHGMKRALGAHAIWVMVVPYCMLHFAKTVPEALASIVAGIVLGTISLRTGSIWGGVAVHVGVAWTMDVLCLEDPPWS